MKRLDGWKFSDVIDFITLHGFVLDHQIDGSHSLWVKSNSKETIINVNFTSGTYPIRTLETMIRQSNIDKTHWVKYTTLSSSLRKKNHCCK